MKYGLRKVYSKKLSAHNQRSPRLCASTNYHAGLVCYGACLCMHHCSSTGAAVRGVPLMVPFVFWHMLCLLCFLCAGISFFVLDADHCLGHLYLHLLHSWWVWPSGAWLLCFPTHHPCCLLLPRALHGCPLVLLHTWCSRLLAMLGAYPLSG